MEFGILSIIPPLIAIIFALKTKEVVVSLMGAIIVGELIIHSASPIDAIPMSVERIISLFSEAWIVKTLLFALFVGSVISLLKASGGVEGFVEYLTKKRELVNSKRGALLLAYIIGWVIFIESSITSLIAGTVTRPISDKLHVSREKLAYVCDSTAAPVSSLIPFNAWGALLLGLIGAQISAGVIEGEALEILVYATAFNLYSISALAFVLYIIISQRDFGPMRLAEERAQNEKKLLADGAVALIDESMLGSSTKAMPKLINMVVPIVLLVGTVPLALFITGDGSMLKGSGSTSVFWAVIVTVVVSSTLYKIQGIMNINEIMRHITQGASAMLPVVMVLVLAFALGGQIADLKTGGYIASLLSGAYPPFLTAALIFIISSIIAFATGTSWGTFTIMIPIAIELSVAVDANLYLVVGAVVSGGVFGDHCSVISDTTIVSSMAAVCDHVDHVNTQLPYALVSGAVALIGFVLIGLVT